MLSTRLGGAALPPGHVDELDDVMAARGLGAASHAGPRYRPRGRLGRHYRRWHAAGHRFVVRADRERVVLTGAESASWLTWPPAWAAVHRSARRRGPAGVGDDPGGDRDCLRRRGGGGPAPSGAAPHGGEDRRRVQEAGRGAGPPLPLRLVVTRVVDEAGAVLAEWWLLTNVADADAGARRSADGTPGGGGSSLIINCSNLLV